ncbi:hypothetical protein [Kordia sp.]|uniref:hypothetical protein n=1 Tax=Kordia sp. TaxID=1965332 RepID=UPI0025C1F90C|nr:hypothetical protein [Kordia sp.]MCH2192840.1 hypothetical protein [Kordia sp.]
MFNFLKGFTDHHKKAIAKLYVASNFSVYDLETELQSFYKKTSQNELTFKRITNGFTVDVDIQNITKKEIITTTRLQLLQNETIIYVVAEHIEIDLSSYQETKKEANFDMRKQTFFKHLQHYLLRLQDDHLYALKNLEQLPFVTSIDLEIQNFIFHVLQEEEYILSILGVSEVNIDTEKYPKLATWHFVLTSDRVFLLVKDAERNFFVVNVSSKNFSIQERTGKDLISSEKISFYTEFMNDTVYTQLLPVVTAKGNRLGVFGDVLANKYHKKEQHLQLASHLFQLQSITSDLLINELKADLIPYLKRLKVVHEQKEAILKVFAKHIPIHKSFGFNLVQVVTDWQLPLSEQRKLLAILQPFQAKGFTTHTISFHEHVHTLFIETEKNAERIFEFNLNFAKHLKNAKRFSDAISIYRMIYASLPDDSITDLLPTKTTNIFNGEGGRQLKVTILEAILEMQQELNEDISEAIHALAELQPLVMTRIEALIIHESQQHKAVIIKEILQAQTLTIENNIPENSYQPIEKKEILQEVVPSCFKEAKGFFDAMNNFIAALNPPDYEAVISFSDRLNTENHPEILQRITAICNALQMEIPECYIGRGTYANAVIGVEGKPSFLIIGNDFLNPKSIRYLEPNALVFLITIELAHMYFEHSKITATDVWRGAADKGFSLVNMLLTVLPFAGNIGTIFGNVSDIEKYGNILQRVEQVANVAEKGKEVKELSEKYNLNPFSKKAATADSSQNLLITSRLMEIVADKVALLFCNDLKAAAKGLLVGTKFYEDYHPLIHQHGIQTFLSQTNAKDEFMHQELIIRLKSLCSFYLSDTFEALKQQLHSS